MAEKKTRKVSICEDPDQEPLRMKPFLLRLNSHEEEALSSTGTLEQEQAGHDLEVPVPPDGGWGWVVCIAGFLCNLILDGTAYTFGVLLPSLVLEFNSDRSSVSWVGSLLCGMYMLSGPLVGGFVNKFGNRPVCIAGGLVAWISISLSTLSVNVGMMIVFYGILGGFGLGLIYLPAVVAVGHYFESKRALATGITVCGSGVGTFLFAPLASYMMEVFTWKTTVLVFASFFLVCCLCGLVMKPLEIQPPGKKEIERLTLELPDGTSDLQNPSNGQVAVMPRISEDDDTSELKVPASPKKMRKISTKMTAPPIIGRNYSNVQLRTLRPRLEPSLSALSMSVSVASFKQSNSQAKLARPFSRKDIFFSGSITNFDMEGEIVVKPNRVSYASIKDGTLHTCLSRASLTNPELKDSTSIMDVLRSMMDFSLLKDSKFLLVGISNIFGFLGFYIPFVYLPSLIESRDGISENEAALVLSVIGISNTVGRILTGVLADRPWADSLCLCSTSLVMSAVCVAIFPLIHSYALFMVVAVVFGLVVAAYIALTSIMLVDLVGIENLTTSFGVVTMFRGAAAIVGPPIGGAVYEATQSYLYSFIVSAAFFLISGLLSFVALAIHKKEIRDMDEFTKRPV